MGTPIEYQKLMTEIVYINLPGPEEPTPGMTGGELLHGPALIGRRRKISAHDPDEVRVITKAFADIAAVGTHLVRPRTGHLLEEALVPTAVAEVGRAQ